MPRSSSSSLSPLFCFDIGDGSVAVDGVGYSESRATILGVVTALMTLQGSGGKRGGSPPASRSASEGGRRVRLPLRPHDSLSLSVGGRRDPLNFNGGLTALFLTARPKALHSRKFRARAIAGAVVGDVGRRAAAALRGTGHRSLCVAIILPPFVPCAAGFFWVPRAVSNTYNSMYMDRSKRSKSERARVGPS